MLYTEAILKKTLDDIAFIIRLYKKFNICFTIVFIVYQLYIITLGKSPIWFIHLALLFMTIGYLVYSAILSNLTSIVLKHTKNRSKSRNSIISELKKKQKLSKKIKKYTSYFLNLVIIGTSIYSLVVTQETLSIFPIVSTTLVVVLFMVKIFFEFVTILLEARKNLIMEAFKIDTVEPISKVKNFFKNIVHTNEKSPEPTKDHIYLDKLVKAAKDEKTAKKAEAKAARNEKLSAWLDIKLSKFTSKQPVDLTVREDVQESTAEIKDAEINLIDAPESPEAIEAPETATITD